MRLRVIFALVVPALALSVLGSFPAQAERARPQLGTLLQELAIGVPAKPFPAPLFTLPALSGAQVELAQFRARVVMLYFWTTYWPYCTRELPSINRLYEEYKPRGFELLLVNLGEDEEHVRVTSKTRGYRVPIVIDSWGKVSQAYAVTGTPTVYLVNRRGLIVGRAIGMRDWAGPRGRAVLEALLADGK